MGIADYFRGPKHKARADQLDKELAALQARHTTLRDQAEQCGALEFVAVQVLIEEAKNRLHRINADIQEAQLRLQDLHEQTKALRDDVLVLDETLLLESFALYTPKFAFTSSQRYKTELDSIRDKQKTLIKFGEAATGDTKWTVNGKVAEGRKMVNDMLKLLIRSFNNECDHCVDNVKFDNIELGEKRILKSF